MGINDIESDLKMDYGDLEGSGGRSSQGFLSILAGNLAIAGMLFSDLLSPSAKCPKTYLSKTIYLFMFYCKTTIKTQGDSLIKVTADTHVCCLDGKLFRYLYRGST